MDRDRWTWLVAGIIAGLVVAYMRPGTGKFGK